MNSSTVMNPRNHKNKKSETENQLRNSGGYWTINEHLCLEIKVQNITPSESLSMRQKASQNSAIWSFVNVFVIIWCLLLTIQWRGVKRNIMCWDFVFFVWCFILVFIDVCGVLVGIVNTRLMGGISKFKREQTIFREESTIESKNFSIWIFCISKCHTLFSLYIIFTNEESWMELFTYCGSCLGYH